MSQEGGEGGKDAAARKVPALTISSRQGSFWRAGVRWTSDPVTVPRDRFSDVQVAQLLAEKQLVVRETTMDASAAKGAGKKPSTPSASAE